MKRRLKHKKKQSLDQKILGIFQNIFYFFPLHHPLNHHVSSARFHLHPYMRTMFISLAIGSACVFASMGYSIYVAKHTRWIMYGGSIPVVSSIVIAADSPFFSVIQGLENQNDSSRMIVHVPPKEYLRKRAENLGYDFTILNEIAYCESKWTMVQNAQSSAFGYFQILDGTERLTPQYREGLRKTDPYANIDMALYLYGKYGTLPWKESKSCWGY